MSTSYRWLQESEEQDKSMFRGRGVRELISTHIGGREIKRRVRLLPVTVPNLPELDALEEQQWRTP